MHKSKSLKFSLIVIGSCLFITGMFGSTTATAAIPVISRAYHFGSNIPNGSIVSLTSQASNYVQPANTTNSSRLVGLVVATNGALLAINPSSSTVQVTTSGTADTLEIES